MKPPSHLKAKGKHFYLDVVSEYGITDAGGIALLTRACECIDRLHAAQKIIRTEGVLTTDRYGNVKQHPAVTLEKDARTGFLQSVKMLNLDLEPILPVGRPSAAKRR